MKIFVILLGLLSAQIAFAESSREEAIPLCSMFHAKKLKQSVLAYGKSDKFAHCALSCQLSLRCGARDAFEIGVLKELWDMVSPGNAEVKDLKANLIGIRFFLQKMAIDDRECVERCDEVNWNNL